MIHDEIIVVFHLLPLFTTSMLFYFICTANSSIWVINSDTISTIHINTDGIWIKKSFIRVYINKCWLSTTQYFIGLFELETNESPKRIIQVFNNSINNFLINPNIILYYSYSLNICEYSE